MDKEELDNVLNDPLLDLSEKEQSLFNIPKEMQKAMAQKRHPDYVAQRKVCEDFYLYRPRFELVHQQLRSGMRNLVKIHKTDSLEEGHFFVIEGQMLLLQHVDQLSNKNSKGSVNGRTRCIYENGTESDILLQTLRKGVVGDGYAITETEDEQKSGFMSNDDINADDQVTGYVYVLKSLSTNPEISGVSNLYKIGFSTNRVEERIANARHEPTYLMADVENVASYKIVNMNSQKFENIVHHVFAEVNFKVLVTDENGQRHEPKEWYVVPLETIDQVIEKIQDGSITHYVYNAQAQGLEYVAEKKQSKVDVSGKRILTLVIKKIYFDEIMSGEKEIEFRALKQTTLNKYTYLDPADGKRYLRRFDALRLYVGYHKERASALVEVKDIIYNKDSGFVEYHLGKILEKL